MPTFVSKRGKLFPAKERVNLNNLSDKPIKGNYILGTEEKGIAQPNEPFVYNGPDREAIKELEKQGLEFLGQDFKDSSEFHEFINTKHQGNMDLYLNRIGYDEKKDEEDFNKRASVMKAHEIKERVAAIKVMGGGQARNKEDSIIGGFGDEKITPAVKK